MVILSCVILVIAVGTFFFSKNNSKKQIIYPNPTDLMYVNDYAAAIDDDVKNEIISLGQELQKKTTAQVVVVVIKSLKGEKIDKYANGLFNKWGIGQKDTNNGLLIVAAIDDRKWRVEVGSGLEKVITDKYSSDVMNDVAKPLFKEGQYGQGLSKVYSIFAAAIANNYGTTLGNRGNIVNNYSPKVSTSSNSSSQSTAVAIIIIIAVIIAIFKVKGTGGDYYHSDSDHGWFSSSGDSDSGDSGGFGGGSSDGGGSSGDW